MTRFLSCGELYETIQQKSLEAKEILWVCSPNLGLDAHKIFSQEILKNPPADIRFVFRVDDATVKRGEVNPYEIQYFSEHFNGSSIRTHENFHSNIYIFDQSALITSANMTKTAFENNIEVGVLIEGSEVDEVKSFFNQSLWTHAKTINDLKRYKQAWNIAQKTWKNSNVKRAKPQTAIRDWTNDYTRTWYIGILNRVSSKNERKIKKETNWQPELSLAGDIGYNCFKEIKLGDLAYVIDLSKKRGKIEIELARVFDKSRVETDQGDLHLAYEIKNCYSIERQQFYEMLENSDIKSRSCEKLLDEDQLMQIANTLSSIKRKRKPKR
ncbi:MAG: phospholipase D-like domain-containing protein [Candidatus Bathyarchaeia archaeon]|jgi:hypothetical protein